MTWRGFVRAVQADMRRAERSAARRHRELQAESRAMAREEAQLQRQAEREYKEQKKLAEKRWAANEAAQYESYVDLIVSLHKEYGKQWDWEALAKAPPPEEPAKKSPRETAARAAADFYRATFFERLFGTHKKVIAAHQLAIAEGAKEDQSAHDESMRRFVATSHDHNVRLSLAEGVLAREPEAYLRALEHANPFEEIVAMGTQVSLPGVQPDVVVVHCDILDEELVPREEVKLMASGKLSTKELPAGRYWLLYQDFVCSAALRLALETFAVLPVDRVIVTVGRIGTNTSTGHRQKINLLTAHFGRESLHRLNLSSIDPSDSMTNFPHRMKFKKTAGFEAVEPITTSEQWVST